MEEKAVPDFAWRSSNAMLPDPCRRRSLVMEEDEDHPIAIQWQLDRRLVKSAWHLITEKEEGARLQLAHIWGSSSF